MSAPTPKSPAVGELCAVVQPDASACEDTPRDECCCYPCGGEDCHSLCTKGCPLSGHAAARTIGVLFDMIICGLTGATGVFASMSLSYRDLYWAGTSDELAAGAEVQTPTCVMSFLAFVCYLVAFCFSCVFLASLSWLEGARYRARRQPDQLFRYDRKDRNLNIILFSLRAVGCLCCVLALCLCVVSCSSDEYRWDMQVPIMCTATVMSGVLVILQPIEQVVGQTLRAKH